MFIWDFSAICAVILIVFFGIVFALWIAYTLNRRMEFDNFAAEADFRQCHYCGYVYMDYIKHSPCRCPRCHSYHDL